MRTLRALIELFTTYGLNKQTLSRKQLLVFIEVFVFSVRAISQKHFLITFFELEFNMHQKGY